MISRRLLIKLTVSAALLVALSMSIDTQALGTALTRLDGWSVLAATALVALQGGLLGWRWHRIVAHLGGALQAQLACWWTQVGIFFNQALPSSVGGDAVRIWLLRKHATNAPALSSVLVERVSGLVVLGMLVSGATLLMGSDEGDKAMRRALLWTGPALLSGTAALLVLGEAVRKLLPQRISEQLGLLIGAFVTMARQPAALVEALLLGAAASGTGLLAAWVLGRSIGIDAGPQVYVAFMGGAVLLTVLPISLGGWGLREAGVVTLFASTGVPREPVLAMSLVWGLLPLLVSAPFAALWWLSRRPAGAARHGDS